MFWIYALGHYSTNHQHVKRTWYNIIRFSSEKRQCFLRNSNTFFWRSTMVYNTNVTEAWLRPVRPSAHVHLNSTLSTEACTTLRTCSLEQRTVTFHSRTPAGLNLKSSRIRDWAGSHRPADFIFICVSRAKTCASCDACKRWGVCAEDWLPLRCRQHPKVLAIMGLGKSIDMTKIGIAGASALSVISISLAPYTAFHLFWRRHV